MRAVSRRNVGFVRMPIGTKREHDPEREQKSPMMASTAIDDGELLNRQRLVSVYLRVKHWRSGLEFLSAFRLCLKILPERTKHGGIVWLRHAQRQTETLLGTRAKPCRVRLLPKPNAHQRLPPAMQLRPADATKFALRNDCA